MDPFYSRPTQYAQDLMSEITATRKIQHSEYEKLFEYYALIRGNITEARKANLVETLLTQANIALMEHPLPTREIGENGEVIRLDMPHGTMLMRSWNL